MKTTISMGNGYAVEFDTDDVGDSSVRLTNDSVDVSSGSTVKRKLTGYCHLYLSFDFKKDRRPKFIKEEDVGTTDDEKRRNDPEGTENKATVQRIAEQAAAREDNARDGNPEGIPADGGADDKPQAPA